MKFLVTESNLTSVSSVHIEFTNGRIWSLDIAESGFSASKLVGEINDLCFDYSDELKSIKFNLI